MGSITQGESSTMKRIWQKVIDFLSKYAQRANSKKRQGKGPITMWPKSDYLLVSNL